MDPDDTENFAVEALYRDVLGEFSTFKNSTARVASPHWVVPTPNLNAQSSFKQIPLDSGLKLKVELPKPFLPPSNVNPSSFKEGDPLELIVQEKEKWEYELQSLLRVARKAKKWADRQKYALATSKVKKTDAEKPLYTVDSYVDVAKHLAKDPHPYFNGKYNWLASGGCISNCNINGEKYIISPRGRSMDTLCFTAVDHCRDQDCMKDASLHLPLSKGQRIYQVVANTDGRQGIAGIRQTKVCSLVKLKQGSTKPLSAKTLLEIQEKDGVFTCIDLNRFEDNQLCTLDSDHCLKLWDLNTSACAATAEVSESESQESPWGFVKFSNTSHEMFILNRSKVFMKDHRMSLTKNVQTFCPKEILDDCEELSLLLNSAFPSLVYIATSHRLLSLDVRCGWIQRWTHLLQAAPIFGSTSYDSRRAEEVIVLSSSIHDDAIAIVNSCSEEKPESYTPPIGLPSVGDCIFLARTQGKCLGPNFSQRLEMATAGLTTLTAEDGLSFSSFKSTSIGDVFSQRFLSELSGTSTILNENMSDIDAWMTWEQAHEEICSKNIPDLTCPTASCDAIFDCIKAPLRKDSDRQTVIENWQKTFPPRNKIKDSVTSSTYSEVLCDLGSYRDLMSGVLLQAWDTEGLTSVPESRNYVESWLADSVLPSDSITDDEDLASIVETASSPRYPRLMSSSSYDQNSMLGKNEHDSTLFKVPFTPSQLTKKIKRESIGF